MIPDDFDIATTSNSSCRICKETIPKGVDRAIKYVDTRWGTQPKYYCLECAYEDIMKAKEKCNISIIMIKKRMEKRKNDKDK